MALTILTAGLRPAGCCSALVRGGGHAASAAARGCRARCAAAGRRGRGGAADPPAARWMREHRGLRAQIIWIDRGLTPEGQEAAARLLRDAAGEQLCAAGQAAEYLERLGPLRPEPGRPGRMGELALGAGAGQRDDCRCGL